jgi:hypothetical protein
VAKDELDRLFSIDWSAQNPALPAEHVPMSSVGAAAKYDLTESSRPYTPSSTVDLLERTGSDIALARAGRTTFGVSVDSRTEMGSGATSSLLSPTMPTTSSGKLDGYGALGSLLAKLDQDIEQNAMKLKLGNMMAT